ncbi:hypothetical protein LTR37_006910 [Vermiconidia calcicola]|uniref:Uncharacterized protein n=1 Tax=Vermiconidia calcicola TaxID=1690605 RepID=A0ACC3NGL8_9PEZI|nr:hypothetical protein LTR37_006910 [Vermiconidia calcicola]
MAAAGFDKRKSSASSLQTPGSGTFPSEMMSLMACSPGGILKKDDLRTPITPPSAYLDFLNKMSPAMMSPAPTSTSSRFNLNENSSERSSEAASVKPSTSPPLSAQIPSLSRNTSYDSNASISSHGSYQSNTSHASSNASSNATARTRPESPRVIIPPSPFARPGAPRSARTPKLRIPQSPFTPALGSANSVPSPYSSTPLSAAPWSASFSPRATEAEGTSQPGKVSVRQVVTRTVTYCRTPLDPAPKGKRRKIEVEDLGSKSSSEEPPIKEERSEDDEETTPSTAQPKSPAKEA